MIELQSRIRAPIAQIEQGVSSWLVYRWEGTMQVVRKIFWLGVSLLAIMIIIKCCAVTTNTDFSETMTNVVKEVIRDSSLSIYEKQSNYMSYIVDSSVLPEIEDSNPIFKFMTSMFPIQQYTIKEKMRMVMSGDEEETDEDFVEVMKLMTSDSFMDRNHIASNDDSTNISGELMEDNEQFDIEANPRDSYYEEDVATSATAVNNSSILQKIKILEKGKDYRYLINNFYIVDSTTYTTQEEFNVEKLLGKDLSIAINSDKPQVLIYHTHASEAFVDSRKNKVDDTVVGVGSKLAKILEEEYGINVIHDTSVYDMMGGRLERGSLAYDFSLKGIKKILEENPSIKVIIDLHRDDANGGEKRVTTIDGKQTAQIMLFNGLSRNAKGDIEYIPNPNLSSNLAFSLQVELQAMKEYPTLMKRIYLKGYRYNLHVVPRSLLVELGTNKNTVEEAKNAMVPFAKVLYQVLSGNTTDTAKDN